MGKERCVSTNFGLAIKLARERKNYSLKDLESICNISASYINRLENCERKAPSVPIVKILADALDLDVSELLSLSSNKDNSEIKDISELLLVNDFTIENNVVDNKAKLLLISILEEIASFEWSDKTKLKDSFEILQIIDEFKKEIA